MKIALRPALLTATLGLSVFLFAQDTPKSPTHNGPPRPRELPTEQGRRRQDEVLPANRDPQSGRDRDASAGNPEGVRHPGSSAFPDTALSVLVLEPGQLERIKAMDERYARQLDAMGSVRRDSPAYLRLREQREREIAGILTPTQFQRWKELNPSPTPPPVPMPNAPPQGPTTPLPEMRADSTHDAMPVVPLAPPK